MNYIDRYGRWHDKPAQSIYDFPSNNAYTYTATAKLLGIMVNYSPLLACYTSSKTRFGFTRHPYVIYPPCSRDEVQGALILGLLQPTELIKDNMYFCNLGQPQPCGFFEKLKLLWSIRKLHRNAVWKIPKLWKFAFTLPPQDQYFVYRVANQNPSLLLKLKFFIFSELTLEKKNKSGMHLLWQKLEYLKQSGKLNKIEEILYRRIDKKQVLTAYFSKDHPFNNL